MARENKRNREMRRLEEKLASFDAGSLEAHFEVQKVSSHSGPLPAPETLAQYDEMMPGLGNRIVTMAEEEAAHRRELETKLLDARIEDVRAERQIQVRGQHYALTIGLVLICAGLAFAGFGYPKTGAALVSGTLVTLVGAFLFGREKVAKQPDKKPDAKKQEQKDELART